MEENVYDYLILTSHIYISIINLIMQETEQIGALAQILESCLTSSSANVALTSLKCGLVYLQHHPEDTTVLTVLAPYVLRLSQLDETYAKEVL